MSKKTIDKLELEKKLEFYLINDIPLSFLFEEYEITFRQRELVLSKIRGFQRQLDRLSETTPKFSYDHIPERYIVSSHQLPEDQSFLTKQEEYNLFKRLDEIKTELEKLPEINISELKLNIELKKQKLEKYDIEQIKKAEKIIDYLENIEKQGQNLSEEIFANLLKKMDLSYEECQKLNQMYNSFLEDQNALMQAKTELSQKEDIVRQKNRLTSESEQIRSKIIMSYIKYVNWVLRRTYNNMPLDKEELQMYGIEGLLNAMKTFDYKLGNRLDTYAFDAIIHNVQRNFKDLTGLEWGVYTKKDSIRYYRELIQEVEGNKREISPQELADSGLISLSARKIEELDEIVPSITPISSVQNQISDEYPEIAEAEMLTTFDEYNKVDTYTDSTEPKEKYDVEKIAMNSIVKDTLLEALDTLTEREKAVIINRFGLLDGYSKTLEEVGHMFNVNRERIRQIEAKALRKLRHPSRAKKLKDFIDIYSGEKESYNKAL